MAYRCGIALTAIVLFAILFRLAVLAYTQPLLDRDSISYLWMAQMWFDHGSYGAMLQSTDIRYEYTPFFSIFLIQATMHLGLSAKAAAAILALVFGSLIPLLGYGIAKTVCRSKKIALLSALFFAINPVLVEYSLQPTREIFYLVWIGLTLLAVCRGIRHRQTGAWAAAGIFCGLACLTRYESFEIPIYLLLYFVVAVAFLKQYRLKKALCAYAVFAAGLVVSIAAVSYWVGAYSYVLDNYKGYFKHSAQMKKLRDSTYIFYDDNHILGKTE